MEKVDPSYTVTIPSEVTLTEEGTPVEIKAEDVKDLDGKKISVTIGGTNYYRNQMVLSGKNSKGTSVVMRYQLITEDGTAAVTVKPVIASSTEKNVVYSGTMTYAVSVTE